MAKNVFGLDEFNSFILENKISLKRGDLQSDVEEFLGSADKRTDEDSEMPTMKADKTLGEDLSKTLRTKWDSKMESENFYRSADGAMKSSYSDDFLRAWKEAAEKGTPGEHKFFYWNGGIYDIPNPKSSLKMSNNFKKWSEIRGVGSPKDEDGIDFVRSYMGSFKNFGGIDPKSRHEAGKKLESAVDSLGAEINEDADTPVYGAYDKLFKCLRNGETPYVAYEDLRGPIAGAIKKIANGCVKNSDFQSGDIAFLNNAICVLAPCVSYDGENFISCYKYILDKVLTPEVMEHPEMFMIQDESPDLGSPMVYFTNENSYGYFNPSDKGTKPDDIFDLENSNVDLSGNKKVHPSLNFLSGVDPDHCSGSVKTMSSGKYQTRPANIFARNLMNSTKILRQVNNHCKRMNAIEAEDVPQNIQGNKCLIIELE
jgi:hypothetical protein